MATIQTNAIIEGVTAGVVGSLLFAGLLVTRDWLRVWYFKRQLGKELRTLGCGWGIAGLNCDVKNRTGTEFVVRELAMVTDKEILLFNATGEVASSWPEPARKPTADEMERMKRGEEVEVGPPLVAHRPFQRTIGTGDFALISPFTKHQFLCPLELVFDSKGTPSHLRIVVECKDWLGRSLLLRETSAGEFAIKHIQTLVECCRDPAKIESLNFVRVKFGLRPVGQPRVVAARPPPTQA